MTASPGSGWWAGGCLPPDRAERLGEDWWVTGRLVGGEGLGPGPDPRQVLTLFHPESPALVLSGLSPPVILSTHQRALMGRGSPHCHPPPLRGCSPQATPVHG